MWAVWRWPPFSFPPAEPGRSCPACPGGSCHHLWTWPWWRRKWGKLWWIGLAHIMDPIDSMKIILLPSEDTAEEWSVEALWRGQPPLHLRHRHLVLGRWAEERQPSGDRAEHIGWGCGHQEAILDVLVPRSDSWKKRLLQFLSSQSQNVTKSRSARFSSTPWCHLMHWSGGNYPFMHTECHIIIWWWRRRDSAPVSLLQRKNSILVIYFFRSFSQTANVHSSLVCSIFTFSSLRRWIPN